MYEYNAELNLELDEEMFEDIMGREPKSEEEWNNFCDAMIDEAYEGIQIAMDECSSRVEHKVNEASKKGWIVV